MARRVFFSFHHQRDSWRVGQVRNCWLGRDRDLVGYLDAAPWEKLKLQGEGPVRRWIDDSITRTSVTTVLIGFETWQRPWVRYEIIKSVDRGNGLLGINIHDLDTQNHERDPEGEDPFAQVRFIASSNRWYFDVYEWTGARWASYSRIPQILASSAALYGGASRDFRLSQFAPRYNWRLHGGYTSIGTWVEQAAARVGR